MSLMLLLAVTLIARTIDLYNTCTINIIYHLSYHVYNIDLQSVIAMLITVVQSHLTSPLHNPHIENAGTVSKPTQLSLLSL